MKLIDTKRVQQKIGRGRQWVLDRRKLDKTFPKPVLLGRDNLYSEQEVDQWIEQQLNARDKQPEGKPDWRIEAGRRGAAVRNANRAKKKSVEA